MELPVGKKQRKEFWKGHFEASENYPGSIAAYCRDHGVPRARMFYYREKFLKQRSGFAEVKENPAKVSVPIADSKIEKCKQLPDPKWLAALIYELSQ